MIKDKRWITIWLITGAVMVAAMVIIGGITRLTHSGLSMTDWKLIMGMIPPLNEVDWMAAFEQYKQFPEFQKVNSHFTLEDFKSIFFWEWLHRFIGRTIGLVFIVPFVIFLIRRSFNRKLIFQSMILLGLGALQGFLGWFMVKSGLIDRPSVSHYRLAIHLCAAFGTFSYIVWVILTHLQPKRPTGPQKISWLARITLAFVIIQIIFGAFVAGLKAGYIYATWPKMGAEWIPSIIGELIDESGLIVLVDEMIPVQFMHRTLAYIVSLLVIATWVIGRKNNPNSQQGLGLNSSVVIVGIQFILGVLTILYVVPIPIAIAHQFGALALLGSSVYLMYQYPIQNR